jgi:hypothetical protein
LVVPSNERFSFGVGGYVKHHFFKNGTTMSPTGECRCGGC